MNDHAEAPSKTRNDEMPGSTRVLTGCFFRHRARHGYRFDEAPAPSPPAPARRPARVAHMLAFAHGIQRAIAQGTYADQADAALHFGLTRARMTQLLDLTLLAPDLQEVIIHLEAVDGLEPLSARALRPLCQKPLWSQQRVLFKEKARGFAKMDMRAVEDAVDASGVE